MIYTAEQILIVEAWAVVPKPKKQEALAPFRTREAGVVISLFHPFTSQVIIEEIMRMRVHLQETVYNQVDTLDVHFPSNRQKRNGLLSSEKTSITVTIKMGNRQRDIYFAYSGLLDFAHSKLFLNLCEANEMEIQFFR